MAKNIRIDIDEKGNVRADFSGYSGDSCLLDEEKLRKALEELGLQADVQEVVPKVEGVRVKIRGESRARRQAGE